MNSKDIYIGKYKIISKLGSGGFSSVYLCQNEQKKEFALKRIKQVKQRYIEQELNALMALKSPFVVQYCENFVYKEYPIIIMEYCQSGTLDQYISSLESGIIQEEKALSIFGDILKGFRAIHEAGFIHRDLKCSNILMDNGIPKISDFGLSKKISSQQMVSSGSCTPSYAAPEVLLNKQHNYKADIWSLGVILYKMVFGCIPFGSEFTQKLIKRIEDLCTGEFKIIKAPKKKIQDVSVGLIRLFKQIFVIDPKKRIGFKELYMCECLQKHIVNVKESMEFYIKQEENGMLQQNMLNSNEDMSPLEEQENEEELEKNEELNREDQMITSIMLQHRIDDPQQLKEVKEYSSCINQYAFLSDSYGFFESAQVCNLLEYSLNSAHILFLKFFLAKQVFYYVSGLQKLLIDKENIFNNENWAQFVYSKSYKQILERVQKDFNFWKIYFEELLLSVESIKDTFPAIKEYLNEELQFNEILYFEKIPDNIKLPSRAVFMTTLKTLYNQVQGKDEITKTQFQQSKSNLLSNPPSISLNKPRASFLQTKEKMLRSTILLRLALCTSWNRIFSVKKEINLLGNKITYSQLLQTIHESDSEKCLKQTLSIIDTYFPKLKDFNFNFM